MKTTNGAARVQGLAGRAVLLAAALSVLPGGAVRGDVVVLNNGKASVGVIDEITTAAVVLYDGNLRRVYSKAEVKEVIRERPDTSWVIVGDLMVKEKDWDAAGTAYQRALALTEQPEVVLGRMRRLGGFRYRSPGSERALALLQPGRYEEAARALSEVVRQAGDGPGRFYWLNRLSEAYVGLSSEKGRSLLADPYLAYAAAIWPGCGAAHAALGDRLQAWNLKEPARREYLLALDVDPANKWARDRLTAAGETWRYDATKTDRSGLRDRVEGQPPLAPGDEPPLTPEALAKALAGRVAKLGPQPARLLLAAYVLEPTTALACNGELPYPDSADLIQAILRETRGTTGTTQYDALLIRAAIRNRIDARLLRAMAGVRSSYRPKYVSPEGTWRGIVPLTSRQWEIAARWKSVDWPYDPDAFDPDKSVELACQYLNWLRREALKPYVGTGLERLERINDNL